MYLFIYALMVIIINLIINENKCSEMQRKKMKQCHSENDIVSYVWRMKFDLKMFLISSCTRPSHTRKKNFILH